MNTSLSLPVHELSEAGEARRRAGVWARQNGCGEEVGARLALVVTELGRNLAIHTKGGRLLLRLLSEGGEKGVQILSLDGGPGVSNFNECLRDGFSTAGTAGIGLGAAKRASQVFSVHSQPGVGTALFCELWSNPQVHRPVAKWQEGAASVALAQEPVCGDSWAHLHPKPSVLRLLVADGLGHGSFAAEASQKAVEVFLANPNAELPILLDFIHAALRATRGAAVAVAEVDAGRSVVSYAGIGNIAGTILNHDKTTSLISMNGTMGVQHRGIRTFSYPWSPDSVLVMNSDGLKTRWELSQYGGLINRHAALIAGVLFRDQARSNDDATVVVARSQP